MTTAVEDAIEELMAASAQLAPIHEGLRDYARLNINADTRAVVDAQLALYDRRANLQIQALAHLQQLVGDGYPALPIVDVPEAVYQDLAENQSTVTAALSKFAPVAPAVDLGLTAGAAERK